MVQAVSAADIGGSVVICLDIVHSPGLCPRCISRSEASAIDHWWQGRIFNASLSHWSFVYYLIYWSYSVLLFYLNFRRLANLENCTSYNFCMIYNYFLKFQSYLQTFVENDVPDSSFLRRSMVSWIVRQLNCPIIVHHRYKHRNCLKKENSVAQGPRKLM